jgi:hypothetical protein
LRGCATVDATQLAFSAFGQELRLYKHNKERAMMDVLMVALAMLWFAAAIGYTYACERL